MALLYFSFPTITSRNSSINDVFAHDVLNFVIEQIPSMTKIPGSSHVIVYIPRTALNRDESKNVSRENRNFVIVHRRNLQPLRNYDENTAHITEQHFISSPTTTVGHVSTTVRQGISSLSACMPTTSQQPQPSPTL